MIFNLFELSWEALWFEAVGKIVFNITEVKCGQWVQNWELGYKKAIVQHRRLIMGYLSYGLKVVPFSRALELSTCCTQISTNQQLLFTERLILSILWRRVDFENHFSSKLLNLNETLKGYGPPKRKQEIIMVSAVTFMN